MRKLHIHLFFTALALFLCSACEDSPTQSVITFSATTTEYEKGSAKTTLDYSAPLWNAGDKICVWGSDGVPRHCLTLEHDTMTALFKYETQPESTVDGPFAAIYPATAYLSPTRIVIPPSQKSTTGRLTQAPMYAASGTTDLQFSNLCGVVLLRLTGESAKRIYYIILMADRKINGEFDLVANPDGSPCPQLSYVSGGSSNTILLVTNALQGDGSYAIAIPAGTYNSLSVFLYSIDRTSCSISLSKGQPITIEQNTIVPFAIHDVAF